VELVYTSSLEGLTALQLTGGFFVGWPQWPTPETHLRILQGSYQCVLAKSADGTVVGYITAVSDGVSCAYISHLEVLPAYQGKGVGSELVQRLLAELEHLYMVDLCCDPELIPFYQKHGFHTVAGMIRRNYNRQRCN
jgi:ribosomal protein S18 acetylase RimI-like enzyme